MGKTKVVSLTAEQRAELEKGYRTGKSHCFRTRCQMILLKSEKRTSVEVAEVLGCCEMAVNNWLARYETEGIESLSPCALAFIENALFAAAKVGSGIYNLSNINFKW